MPIVDIKSFIQMIHIIRVNNKVNNKNNITWIYFLIWYNKGTTSSAKEFMDYYHIVIH